MIHLCEMQWALPQYWYINLVDAIMCMYLKLNMNMGIWRSIVKIACERFKYDWNLVHRWFRKFAHFEWFYIFRTRYFDRSRWDMHASHDFVAFNQAIFGSNHKIICGVVWACFGLLLNLITHVQCALFKTRAWSVYVLTHLLKWFWLMITHTERERAEREH